jgi:hypothetical protein
MLILSGLTSVLYGAYSWRRIWAAFEWWLEAGSVRDRFALEYVAGMEHFVPVEWEDLVEDDKLPPSTCGLEQGHEGPCLVIQEEPADPPCGEAVFLCPRPEPSRERKRIRRSRYSMPRVVVAVVHEMKARFPLLREGAAERQVLATWLAKRFRDSNVRHRDAAVLIPMAVECFFIPNPAEIAAARIGASHIVATQRRLLAEASMPLWRVALRRAFMPWATSTALEAVQTP